MNSLAIAALVAFSCLLGMAVGAWWMDMIHRIKDIKREMEDHDGS